MVERVMIVDDEEGILALLRRVLRAPGREVEVFPAPTVALDAMRRYRPDVVITDLHMPGMSGPDFIRRIRDEFGARLGIIVITAFPTLVSDADAVAHGIGAYLRKPFTDLELLRSTVSEVIEESRRSGEAQLPEKARRHLQAADVARRQHRASLSRADAVLDLISDAILITDRNGNLLQLNPAAARLLGTAAEECLARPLSQIPMDEQLRAAVLEPGQIGEQGVPSRRITVEATGTIYEVKTAPLVAAMGGLAGVFSVVKDVSAEVRVQELKHHYLTVLAHELRTPLTALTSFVSCLERAGAAPMAPRQLELVAAIQAQASRLEHQVDKLILLARLERGDLGAESQAFEVGAAVAQALASFSHEAREGGITLSIDTGTGPILARGDADDFGRALYELGENAIKFTPPGGRVDVSVSAVGDLVQVRLSDTGIGIDPRHHAAIFTEFRQLEDSVTRKHAGAGLGLGLARRILEAAGGRITLESELGKGSTFTLLIPRDRGEVAGTAGRPGAASSDSACDAAQLVDSRNDEVAV